MGKSIRLTEEQYKKMLDEGLFDGKDGTNNGRPKIEVGVKAPKDNPNQLGQNLKQKQREVQQNGLKPEQVKYVVEPEATMESYIITKKQLSEHKRRMLKESSELYTVKNFMNKLKK